MKANYYDPLFYISSDKMPFTIRIETVVSDSIEPDALEYAVQLGIKRYPYFAVRIVEENGEYLTVPNSEPVAVYEGPAVYPLGSEQVNRHILAVSYYNNEIYFDISHVITDGNGFYPFIKTVLYYYCCRRYGLDLDPAGINMADDPLFSDEITNPYPEESMKIAEPLYEKKIGRYFRLCDGPYVKDEKATVYRCRVPQYEMMRFNYDNDGSPCILVSVLMAKAIWSLHPEVKDDLVSAISFNLRPGLGNKHNYRMLCSAIHLDYHDFMRDYEISKLCTCSRGMVTLQSQPENVLYYAKQRKERFEAIKKIPGLNAKKELMGNKALVDSISNTFSVSYVGRPNFGSLEPYVREMYPITDGSVYKTLFLEISSVDGWFDIAFLQGFSSDSYYRAFLSQLTSNGLCYEEGKTTPLLAPKMML